MKLGINSESAYHFEMVYEMKNINDTKRLSIFEDLYLIHTSRCLSHSFLTMRRST
ncbi:hypothetical protein SAMN06265348_103354 [Pedobacter westerhofensis]|uniref:Uncharacterized protein n=1 Tax=Pedobacter westerhofensis TaxID=425512 RepID=A0A521C9N3_9SPHI|nr:hypothetical protein SAMN06265348_103354 [Pedobacter westerhofensis]